MSGGETLAVAPSDRGAEGRARPWVGALPGRGCGALWQPGPSERCAMSDGAMRPPGGRVGRGPGWSPGPETVGSAARNRFPISRLKTAGHVTFSAACQTSGNRTSARQRRLRAKGGVAALASYRLAGAGLGRETHPAATTPAVQRAGAVRGLIRRCRERHHVRADRACPHAARARSCPCPTRSAVTRTCDAPLCSRTRSSCGSGRVMAFSCHPSDRMKSQCESSVVRVPQHRSRDAQT